MIDTSPHTFKKQNKETFFISIFNNWHYSVLIAETFAPGSSVNSFFSIHDLFYY